MNDIIEHLKDRRIIHSTDSLKQLILDNPEAPLVVLAGEYANRGDYGYFEACASVVAYLGQFLDCEQTVRPGFVYCDKDQFEDELAEKLSGTYDGKDLDTKLSEDIEKYKPYWRTCIIIQADN